MDILYITYLERHIVTSAVDTTRPAIIINTNVITSAEGDTLPSLLPEIKRYTVIPIATTYASNAYQFSIGCSTATVLIKPEEASFIKVSTAAAGLFKNTIW